MMMNGFGTQRKISMRPELQQQQQQLSRFGVSPNMGQAQMPAAYQQKMEQLQAAQGGGTGGGSGVPSDMQQKIQGFVNSMKNAAGTVQGGSFDLQPFLDQTMQFTQGMMGQNPDAQGIISGVQEHLKPLLAQLQARQGQVGQIPGGAPTQTQTSTSTVNSQQTNGLPAEGFQPQPGGGGHQAFIQEAIKNGFAPDMVMNFIRSKFQQ